MFGEVILFWVGGRKLQVETRHESQKCAIPNIFIIFLLGGRNFLVEGGYGIISAADQISPPLFLLGTWKIILSHPL